CREHRLDEKWVVSPSLRAANQWLDRVARAGCPVINARPTTVRSMALDLAGAAMARDGLEMVTPRVAELIVDRLWADIAGDGRYLGELERTIDFSRAMHRTLSDLRLAGLGAGDLDSEDFEVPAKRDEVARLLEAYLDALDELGLVDYAGALRMAREKLEESGLPHDVLVLLPDAGREDYNRMELRLMDALPASACMEIDVDEPARPPQAPGEDGVEFFRALGASNEVREVLRRCTARGILLDRVEVLHTDAETYVPLFLEISRVLLDDPDAEGDRKVTFAEGIPVRYSRPGRALSGWLEWMDEGYPRVMLRNLIQDGLLALPEEGEEVGFSELADALRTVPVYEGRDNYLPAIDRRMQAVRSKLSGSGGPDEERDRTRGRSLRRLQVLRTMVENLLSVTAEEEPGGAALLGQARTFLQDCARRADEFDEFAREKLLDDIDEVQGVAAEHEDELSLDIPEWLAGLPAESTAGGQGPRPGALHVSHALSGGHSGRPYTFVVGLDDSRFPSAGGQDPFLLDGERSELSDALTTSPVRRERQFQRLWRTLAGLRGRVTLSYSCRDLVDDRELFPAQPLISAYRDASGNRQADQRDFLDAEPLQEPVSFAPDRPEASTDEGAWYMWRLCREGGMRDRRNEVAARFPHLQRGLRAERNRAGESFTAHDGRVPAAGKANDPREEGGPVVSAHRMQTAGKCPRRYFFQRVLDVEPPDELEYDPDEWLDPLEVGSVLHSVYHDFVKDMVDEGRIPDPDRDLDMMLELLEDRLEEVKQENPPPRDDLEDSARRDMERACYIFLARQEELYRRGRPQFLETALGMWGDDTETPLDTEEPVALPLPDGHEILVRGRLDRVD
ncbi:MAG: PD-(D/E)XK nuclease family protein, partial [Planctomycetota bacterium]